MITCLAIETVGPMERPLNCHYMLPCCAGGKCCPARRGEWWVRLALDTEHLGRAEESLEVRSFFVPLLRRVHKDCLLIACMTLLHHQVGMQDLVYCGCCLNTSVCCWRQVAETALADEWVKHGERLALQKRILRLGKPPRRWKRPPWAQAAQWDPREVRIEAQPLPNALGIKSRFLCPSGKGDCTVEELALAWYAEEEHGSWQGASQSLYPQACGGWWWSQASTACTA